MGEQEELKEQGEQEEEPIEEARRGIARRENKLARNWGRWPRFSTIGRERVTASAEP